ncbi:glycoside hydrolase family 2 TIM barrel-domain containing protein [Vibrio aestuarianus]|uniref:Glycoside hydrolase family 2 TIM barrel-domain containing protein n=1 Tax=Vibrio aestuarianus TaxID=28171 RepID=A0AAX3U1Q2_9VIBR|nr:glycoside hydrolase family 2 TIM barrel-domain containing protein [Vibrio aestuarianus]WGK81392.1 glycoside hydrolase family 2 TIM barrel-domain containing protein [Vibrio aestuarianus]
MSQIINLNSGWSFTKLPLALSDIQTTDASNFESITIPHCWNAIDGQNGGDNYHRGLCWYKKSLNIQAVEEGKCYFIEIGAANSISKTYLNGELLGEHRGGYSKFRYDITKQLKEGDNELLISVDNSHVEEVYPLWADFTFYGGIYRDVNLVVAEDVHFNMMDLGSPGIYVSQREVTDQLAKLEVKALVQNNTQHTPELLVEFVDRKDTVVAQAKTEVTGESATLELDVENPVLWQGVDNPYLYECRVKLMAVGELKDIQNIPTGLRYFEFDKDRGFMLNGKPTKIRGVSRHQDREAVGNALTKGHQLQDMELIKEVGANSIRLAHYQHSDFFYDLCDEAGMLIWAEPPYITKTSNTDREATNAISQMRELVRQAYNHSSIILWGVQNEIGIFPAERPLLEIVQQMHNVVKEEDTTRLTTQAQVMMIREDNPANFATDTVAFNQYHGWYVGDTSGYDKFIQAFREKNPNSSLGYSEYGAEGIIQWHSEEPKANDYSEEYHAKYHEEVLEIFNRYDYMWGSYVWNFFDFGSDLRDEGGVKGRNNKGLVTFDRGTKKDAFFFYKSVWSSEPVVHIASKRFKERHLDTITVKVYCNQEGLELRHNGRLVALKERKGTTGETIYLFDVTLESGYNQIEATASGFTDRAEFRKVAELNQDYILPKGESTNIIDTMFKSDENDENVRNWFTDGIEDAGVQELEYPEGFLSIRDRICEIMEEKEGKAIMEELFKPLLENEKAEMVLGMPFDMLIEFKPDMFPTSLVQHFNSRLNKVKKTEKV